MPVGATILARLKPPAPDDAQLQVWGAALQRDLELEDDDFNYNPHLSLVTAESWNEIPEVEEPSVWLELNLLANYYGPGYERGDIELYVRCAVWMEEHLPDCEVYYGTDCGVAAEPFDAAVRARYLNYFRQVGWEPYRNPDEKRAEELRALWESS